MKYLYSSRRRILRAIHTACVALLLAAAASRAQAQIATAPFAPLPPTPPTETATTPGVYSGAVGFYDNVNTYNSISVGSGVVIQNTAQYGTSVVNGIYGVITGSTANLTNAGTLSISTAADPSQADVNLSAGATPLTVTNSGTMTVSALGNIGYAIFVVGGAGPITATNSGTMSVTGGADSNVVDLNTVSGNISFTNSGAGSVTLNNPGLGYAIKLETGNANVAFENDGSIVSTSNGVRMGNNNGTITATNNGTIQIATTNSVALLANSAGPINVTNNGTLTSSDGFGSGINAQGGSAAVTVANHNTISNLEYGMSVFSSGPQSVTNTGTITSSVSGIYGTGGGPASGSIITNSGVINSGGTGILNFGSVTVRDSGNITSTGDSITVASGSSVTLSGRPIINNTISGGPTAASTSTLAFNLTVDAADYAADKAELNAEIAQYAAQNGGNLTFDIGSLVYLISDFAPGGVTDDLLPFRIYADVPGFSGLGSALDNMNGNSPAAAKILDALAGVSDPGLPNALAELSPKSLEVFRNIAFDNNTFYVDQINNHLANLRDGMTGFDSSAFSVNDSDSDPGVSGIQNHLNAYSSQQRQGMARNVADPKDMKDAKEMAPIAVDTEPSQRWSTFIAGNVILANLDNTVPYQNTDYTTGAVTAGADYRLDDHFTVGALFSYAHTGVDLDYLGSKATVDSYAPGIYASYVDGGWYANGLATYVRNSYTEDRMIDIPGLSGDNHGATSGNEGTGDLTGGYEFHSGGFKFGPVATVEYVHLDVDSIQEQGPTALSIDDQSVDSLRTLLGFEGRFATAVDTCCGKWLLTPHFSASWQHEYLDNSNGITSQFNPAGGGAFNVQTDQPERDSAFVDAGLDLTLTKAATIFVDYQAQVGQTDFFAQSVQGGVEIKF
jgi:uncharacterized protein with beta-barrel porin domain